MVVQICRRYLGRIIQDISATARKANETPKLKLKMCVLSCLHGWMRMVMMVMMIDEDDDDD